MDRKNSLPPSVGILESEFGHVPLGEGEHIVVEESTHLGELERRWIEVVHVVLEVVHFVRIDHVFMRD